MPTKYLESKLIFQNYKNKLTIIIRLSQKKYYADKFGNIKGTWKIINNILHENSCATVNSSVTEILSGGNIIHDSQEIVSKFNDFLVNTGPDLAKKIIPENPNTLIMDTMPTPNFASLFIAPRTSNEIQTVVANMSNRNGIGIERFSIKSIKSVE